MFSPGDVLNLTKRIDANMGRGLLIRTQLAKDYEMPVVILPQRIDIPDTRYDQMMTSIRAAINLAIKG
jgi:hypothetical protein